MRAYEQRYGYTVPPPPSVHWTWHLRWMLPAFLLLGILLALPQFDIQTIDLAAVGGCTPAPQK